MKNIIKTLLTPEQWEQIKYHLAQIEAILAGKMVAIDAQERRRYGSVRENNKLLIDKVYGYYQSTPAKCSPDINWEEFEKDYSARKFYEGFLSHLTDMIYRVQGTKILHDYDNYQDALREYAYTSYKNNVDEAGYEIKAADLKQFFNRSGTAGIRKKKNKE